MRPAQKKQNVHHLKKNDNEKEFALRTLFLTVIWLTDASVRMYNETYV